MKITLREFFDSKDKLAIHCDTLEKAKTLLTAFDKMGKRWDIGGSYATNFRWSVCTNNTCYSNKGTFGDTPYYLEKNVPIYSFEDVIFPSEVKVKEPKSYKVFDATYLVHDYALTNLIGKENAMSSSDLAKRFDISERRLRDIRVNHNDPRSPFHHLLLTCQKGYFIATEIEQYTQNAWRLLNHGKAEIKQAKVIFKHTKLDGTMRLKLTEYMKETISVIAEITDEKGE